MASVIVLASSVVEVEMRYESRKKFYQEIRSKMVRSCALTRFAG